MFCSFFYFLKDQNKVPKERYVYRTKIIIMQHNNSQTYEALAVNRGMLQRSHGRVDRRPDPTLCPSHTLVCLLSSSTSSIFL